MKYPFTRTAHAGKYVGASQLFGHTLATIFGILCLSGTYNNEVHRVWAGIDLQKGLADLMILNALRSLLFIFFWTFTIGYRVSILAVVVAIVHFIAKIVVSDWHNQLLGLPLAIFTFCALITDSLMLRTFYVTEHDPDMELMQQVEGTGRGVHQSGVEMAELGAQFLPEDAPQRGKASVLRTLARFTSPDVGLLTMGALLMFLSMGSQLLLPGFTGRCLAAALLGGEGSVDFTENMVGLILTSLMLAYFSSTRIWNTAKLEVRLVCRVQRILFACILQRDVSYFDDVGTGQLTSRIASDAQMLASIMTTNINLVLQKGIILFGALSYMFAIDAVLATEYFAVALSFFAFTRWFGRLTARLSKTIQSVRADANNVAMQSLSGIRTVRAFTAEDFERQRYDEENRNLVYEQLRLKMCYTCYSPLVTTIANGLQVLVLFLGGGYVAQGVLAPESLASFVFYSQMVQEAMNTLANQIVAVYQGLGAGEKIFEIIAAPPPKVPLKGGLVPLADELAAIPSRGTPLLEFRATTFRFPSEEKNVLQSLNFVQGFGQTVGIVGPSGSGKSTLLSLAMRFYDPSAGEVYFFGWDLRSLDPSWLRKQIACVPQDPMLFDTTVRENVAYALPETPVSDVEQALKRSEAFEFVSEMSEGMETKVGERGVKISGGQRQRLALARALLHRPRLLAFDEATSALDTATEAKVNESVLALHAEEHQAGRGFGMIVIAHRLTTVRDLDLICVVKQGSVAEQGTHKELMNRKSVYYDLVQKAEGEGEGGEIETLDNMKRQRSG